MYTFAFSHKEFVIPGKHTSVFRAAVDAFNIFDLFYEVWKNMKWLFLAVILRRPYARAPEDGKFDIYDAMNGKRDVAAYQDSYAMLDVPHEQTPNETSHTVLDEESALPPSLVAGGARGKYKPVDEGQEIQETKSQEYSNTYGERV